MINDKISKHTGCKCAVKTDQWHGWKCKITDGECMYLSPDSKACARDYGEGPDAVTEVIENE